MFLDDFEIIFIQKNNLVIEFIFFCKGGGNVYTHIKQSISLLNYIKSFCKKMSLLRA